MNRKRAFWTAVLLYVVTFIVGIGVAIFVGTDFTGEEPISKVHWIWSIVLSVMFAGLFSAWYFMDKKVKTCAKEGCYLGLTFFAVGIFFDLLFLIPYLLSGVGDASVLVGYYKDVWFWVSVVLIVLTPVAVGHWGDFRK